MTGNEVKMRNTPVIRQSTKFICTFKRLSFFVMFVILNVNLSAPLSKLKNWFFDDSAYTSISWTTGQSVSLAIMAPLAVKRSTSNDGVHTIVGDGGGVNTTVNYWRKRTENCLKNSWPQMKRNQRRKSIHLVRRPLIPTSASRTQKHLPVVAAETASTGDQYQSEWPSLVCQGLHKANINKIFINF